jgi:hypothetical protein
MTGDAFDWDAMLAQARRVRPQLIGLCGPIGAGKTFAADHLARDYGYSRVRFAGLLKDMLRALGLSKIETDGDGKERPCKLLGGKTPRYAMQMLGTKWGRDLIDPDLWVRAWEHRAAPYLDKGLPVVVDDVRFVNEATAILRRGGVLVRIDRPGCEDRALEHESERQALPFDYRIENSGDEEFRAALTALVVITS